MANCSGCPYRWHDSDCEYCSARGDLILDGTSYSKSTCEYYKEYEKEHPSSASSGSDPKGCIITFIVIALIAGIIFGGKYFFGGKRGSEKDNDETSITETVDADYPAPTGNLQPGDNGDGVRWLQVSLTKLGYPVTVDGNYGDSTTEAVKQFQTDYGLEADGYAGPKTQERIKSLLG